MRNVITRKVIVELNIPEQDQHEELDAVLRGRYHDRLGMQNFTAIFMPEEPEEVGSTPVLLPSGWSFNDVGKGSRQIEILMLLARSTQEETVDQKFLEVAETSGQGAIDQALQRRAGETPLAEQMIVSGGAGPQVLVVLRSCFSGDTIAILDDSHFLMHSDLDTSLRLYCHKELGMPYFTTKFLLGDVLPAGPSYEDLADGPGPLEIMVVLGSKLPPEAARDKRFLEAAETLGQSARDEIRNALFGGQDPDCFDDRGETALWKVGSGRDLYAECSGP